MELECQATVSLSEIEVTLHSGRPSMPYVETYVLFCGHGSH